MRTKIPKIFAGIFFIMNALMTIPLGHAATDAEPIVRIAIMRNRPGTDLEIHGAYQIIDPLNGQVLRKEPKLRRLNVAPVPGGFKVGETVFHLKRIRVASKEDIIVYEDAKPTHYRGSIDVLPGDKQSLTLINRLGLEDYVRGILSQEVSHHWPMEVLKAQAVVSRTYAIHQMQVNNKRDYDMTADIYSQVYGGMTSERYQSNLAVARTEGQVLLYQGLVIPAYFHSTCGGYTEDVHELWEHEKDLPPLKGVRCGYCGHSKHSWWKINMKLADIEKRLTANNHPVGPIKDIFILQRNPSGRIRTLEIVDRNEKILHISGKDFREIIGPNLIKSNDYYVVMKGWYADFIGRGWGHGVGLCQWGAHGMAQKGKNYQQILSYYYPGTDLADYRTLPNLPKTIP